MKIYNLFPLLAGEVKNWKGHAARAAEMGFDHLFVNPIHQPGMSGSLYSIRDYFDLNPLIAEGKDSQDRTGNFRRAACEIESMGLKLIADLVVDHCAIDSPLVKEHPEWFLHENGEIAHPWCLENKKKVVWGDLAQFDLKKSSDAEGLYQYLFKVVLFLTDIGFRGFRCDAAYQVPSPFWRRLIGEARKRRQDLVFFAETLGCSPAQLAETAQSGFDYIFNSSKWWNFSEPWLMAQYNCTRDITKSVSFPESHDTPRLAEEMQGNVDAVKQRYFLSALFSAGVMIPIGFEYGFRKRLHVVKTRPTDWEQPSMDLTGFIKAMNRVRTENAIFQEDAPTDILACDNPAILLIRKSSWRAGQQALLILNKDVSRKQSFHADNLYDYVHAEGPLRDVSPEYPLDYLPTPYNYDLRPGQGIVLVTGKPK